MRKKIVHQPISRYCQTKFLDVPFEVLKTPFIYIFRTKSLITVQSVKYFFYIPDRKIFVVPHFKSSCFVVVHKKRKKKKCVCLEILCNLCYMLKELKLNKTSSISRHLKFNVQYELAVTQYSKNGNIAQ